VEARFHLENEPPRKRATSGMKADETGLWDRRFLELAAKIGSWSKDHSAKTGSIIADRDRIIRSTGFNGFARGINDDVKERYERPAKYSWTEHAERNAIYNAARNGTAIANCTCYVNWFPCVDCARAIIQTGIARVVGLEPDRHDEKWGGDFRLALEMFSEAGVEVALIDMPEFAARR
jgi:dCMP deaminase